MSPHNKKVPISVSENFRISVEEIVNKFRQDPSKIEYVFPSTLSNVERAFIHELVKTHGLQSRSHGKEPNRCIKIFKKNKFSSVNESIIELSEHSLNNVKSLLKDFPLTIEDINDNDFNAESSDAHESKQNMVLNKTMGKLHDAFPLKPPGPSTTMYDYAKQELPIWCFRDKIVNTIAANQVIFLMFIWYLRGNFVKSSWKFTTKYNKCDRKSNVNSSLVSGDLNMWGNRFR